MSMCLLPLSRLSVRLSEKQPFILASSTAPYSRRVSPGEWRPGKDFGRKQPRINRDSAPPTAWRVWGRPL